MGERTLVVRSKVLSCLRSVLFTWLLVTLVSSTCLIPFAGTSLSAPFRFPCLPFVLSGCVSLVGLFLCICMALLQMTSLSASFATFGFAALGFSTFGFATRGF